MASACLNTIGLSPENLLDRSQNYSPYGWFSPRLSISREMPEEDASRFKNRISPVKNGSGLPEVTVPFKEVTDLTLESDTTEFDGFEFRLVDPAMMLPADELFSDGKLVPLVPLQFSVNQPEVATTTTVRRIVDDADPYLYSPRAPRCSSRWKELLGFRKLHQSSNSCVKPDNKRTTSLASSHNATGASATRSIRQLLYRNSKPATDSSINLPLLNNADNESVTVSLRPSLSSSSSGHDTDDLPRVFLDSDLPRYPNYRSKTRPVKTRTQSTDVRSTTRVGRTTLRRSTDATTTTNHRCLSVDSPRINSSGKIVFHSLERSSSSPSSLIGGPRFKHRGMERSYSGNVRITPVLNVPVCSLRGSSKSGSVFGLSMFSNQKREGCSSGNNGGSNRSQRFTGKPRTDCC